MSRQWKPVEVPTDDDRVSDTPCPLGCGYRPTSAWDAFKHVVGHGTGNYTDGAEQQERLGDGESD